MAAMDVDGPAVEGAVDANEEERRRFQVELEFIQCLANPHYLHFLGQQQYFQDESFVNYLRYLLYWKSPEYAKFIKYPQCLYFLELLQNERFRGEMANKAKVEVIAHQQYNHWRFYAKNRAAAAMERAQQQQQQQQQQQLQKQQP